MYSCFCVIYPFVAQYEPMHVPMSEPTASATDSHNKKWFVL